MDIVIDASAILAVIVDEPERDRIIDLTKGHNLLGPGSIPWEIGNAFTSMLKQHRIDLKIAKRGLTIFQSIPIRYVSVNFNNAISIAHANKMYAYDAYFLDCASRHNIPLLTLDRPLTRIANKLGIQVIEV